MLKAFILSKLLDVNAHYLLCSLSVLLPNPYGDKLQHEPADPCSRMCASFLLATFHVEDNRHQGILGHLDICRHASSCFQWSLSNSLGFHILWPKNGKQK